jgi:hypothetical protein
MRYGSYCSMPESRLNSSLRASLFARAPTQIPVHPRLHRDFTNRASTSSVLATREPLTVTSDLRIPVLLPRECALTYGQMAFQTRRLLVEKNKRHSGLSYMLEY